MGRSRLVVFTLAALVGCVTKPAAGPPGPEFVPPEDRATVRPAAVETLTVKDPELERRIARLELQLWERDAQADELGQRLDEARQEVVRAMAKLQTLATRAEAGSAMAEADVALQQARSSGQLGAEVRQATQLMLQSQAEFNKQNFGGALYLASQAKTIASASRRRLAVTTSGRQGEVVFALPIALKSTSRANVREGPGTNFPVVFAAESGTLLTGVSYLGEWVRVSDDGGRTGWVIRSLLAPR